MKKYVFLISDDLKVYEQYVDFILANRNKFYSIFDLFNECYEHIKNNKLFSVYNRKSIEDFKHIYVEKFEKDYLMFFYPIAINSLDYIFFEEYVLNHSDIRLSKKAFFFYKKIKNSDEILNNLEKIKENFPIFEDMLKIKKNYFYFVNDNNKIKVKKFPMKKISTIVDIVKTNNNVIFY